MKHSTEYPELHHFLSNTKNGIKESHICILHNPVDADNLSIIEYLLDELGKQNVCVKQLGFLKRPTTGNASKLIVIVNPEDYEFDDCIPHIKEYLSEDVVYRRPYLIQTLANIIILTKDLSFFDSFTHKTKSIFKIVNL